MPKKIVMVGMNPRTRDAIPWDDDAEFWTLNEGATKDWMKRWDVLFQIHPRWDWDRPNNMADPNHPLFIKAQNDICLYCKGSRKAYSEGNEINCPWCNGEGVYYGPMSRYQDNGKPKRIIMQDDNKDVPGCIRFPVETITQAHCKDGKPYFTSTLAHMLAYAIHFLPDMPIELYGFEAESNTEYAVQRPCIEYWVGYGRGKGMSIEAPGSHLLQGRHYAYEDFDQGYRSRLELRKRTLQENLNSAEVEAVRSEARLDALMPFKDDPVIKTTLDFAYDDHFKKKNMVSFIRGTLKELHHAIEILDAYRQDMDEATQADIRRLVEIPYQLGQERGEKMKLKTATALIVLLFFFSSIALAWIWFGWKMAVLVTLVNMTASGNASLKDK